MCGPRPRAAAAPTCSTTCWPTPRNARCRNCPSGRANCSSADTWKVRYRMSSTAFSLPPEEPWSDADLAKIGHLKEAHDKIVAQIRKAVVGQDNVVNLTMIGLFGQGHCLLMGVPGLGKTLLVRTLASSLSLQFRR